jgi:hypothetical protein
MEVSMASTDVSGARSMATPEAGPVDMALEVVTLPVSDVDRAKRFYESLGWRLDADNGRLQEVTTRLPGREWEDTSSP